MKKHLFIAAVLLTLCQQSNKANAQSTFAPVGAEWWHYILPLGFNPESWLFHSYVTKDTSIQATACTELKIERLYGFNIPATVNDTVMYLHTVNDSVFVFNNVFNRFTPLYVYNVSAGDTVCLPVPPGSNDLRINPYTGDTSFCYIIDSVKLEQYDTSFLRTYYSHPIASFDTNLSIGDFPSYSWSGTPYEGKYMERLGGQWSLLPIQTSIATDIGNMAPGPNGAIWCYTDTAYSIRLGPGPCDSVTYYFQSVGINKITELQNSITLFPNPAASILTIKTISPLPSDAELSLKDISGRTVIQFPVMQEGAKAITYDISGIAPGIYFVKIQFTNIAIQKKIVISR